MTGSTPTSTSSTTEPGPGPADAPVQRATDQPGAGEPGVDEPGLGESGAGDTGAGEPGPDEPGAEPLPAPQRGAIGTDDGGLLEVGRVAKAHGIKGDVVVELLSNRPERTEPGAELRTPEGAALVVDSARTLPVGKGPGQRWLVRFRGVADRAGAERLSGTPLLAAPLEDDGALWVHRLVGSTVVDASGRAHGTVTAVLANPASDLLELDGGQLVPLRFVTGHTPGRIAVDVPAGLLD